MQCRWALEPSRARSQRAQVFTEHLWKVCIESDGVNCASSFIGHSFGGCLDIPDQSRQAEEEHQESGAARALRASGGEGQGSDSGRQQGVDYQRVQVSLHLVLAARSPCGGHGAFGSRVRERGLPSLKTHLISDVTVILATTLHHSDQH